MNFKSFLKPSKAKIIGLIIILILGIVLAAFSMPCPTTPLCPLNKPASECGKLPVYSAYCEKLPSSIILIFFWPALFAISILSSLGTLTANVQYMLYLKVLFRIFILIFGIALNLFYLYFIGCLIVSLFKKK